MREIKFRAWDKHNKTMHPDCYYGGDQKGVNEIIAMFAEDMLWQQYTGLKDKNGDVGQEVYEGDIIDEYGKIKGNIYEMDATDSDLVITNLTERDWYDTYKKAMDRGLTHA